MGGRSLRAFRWIVASAVTGCGSPSPFTVSETDAGGPLLVASEPATAGALGPFFDTNDVSMLFPLPEDSASMSLLLGLDAVGVGGALLSEDLFNAVVAGFQLTPPALYADWRIVALRFDPC